MKVWLLYYWISSEVLNKDILEASKIMETLEEVDRLVMWIHDLNELMRRSEEVRLWSNTRTQCFS